MKKGDYLSTILRSNKTVFTLKDILLLWQEENTNAARVRLNYYVKKGGLFRVRRGFYAKSKMYNKKELANRIFTPSYISFETVLVEEGLIFQYNTDITIASYLTRSITIDGQTYNYRKIKDNILIDNTGVLQKDNISKASRERAFLDMLYSNVDYHFDNIRSIDSEKVFNILPIYNNKRMINKAEKLFKNKD